MPWKTKKASGGGYDIVKSDTGEKVGHSDTKAKADASVRARYANTNEGGTKSKSQKKK
jgi:hypothetical protein